MNCYYCNQDIGYSYASVCNKCPYKPRHFYENSLSETPEMIDFEFNIDSKRYFVVYVLDSNSSLLGYNIKKAGVAVDLNEDHLYFEEGKIISSPQDAFNFLHKVLNLKAFL